MWRAGRSTLCGECQLVKELQTQCHRHRMSCSNPYTLACIWTVISTFTFADKRDIFSSECNNVITVSRKSGF